VVEPPKLKIIGVHTCEGRAKAAALPPKHELRSQGLKTGVKYLLYFALLGKNSRLVWVIKIIKIIKTCIYVRWI
jgi:hypothetical protein